MAIRRCSKCGNEGEEAEAFYCRKTGPRAGEYYERCIECFKSRGRRYYRENALIQRPKAITRNQTRTARLQALVILAKRKPCADCKHAFDHWQMDFDHRPGEIKYGDVSDLVANGVGESRVLEEIKKCDVVCANCHRTRTVTRRWSAALTRATQYLLDHEADLVDKLAS